PAPGGHTGLHLRLRRQAELSEELRHDGVRPGQGEMKAWLAIVLGAVLVLPLTARALPEETWVLAIGHNAGAQEEGGLLYAEQDARTLADALREQGGVSTRRMVLVLGENAASVRGALQDVNAKIRARTGEGKHTALIVFYSGHADASALHLGGTELPL